MTRVCLWGTSLGKVADEAQFLAVLRLVERAAPGADVTILARPGPRSQPGNGSGIRILPTFRIHQATAAIARADLFVMVGGCFMESPRQAAVCAGLTAIARICRTPVIGIGVTAFPYRRAWGRLLYRSVFNAMEAITAREPSARDALLELPVGTRVEQLADPRYVLAPPPDQHVRAILERYQLLADKPLIGVTLRHLHDNMPNWVKVAHGYTADAAQAASRAIAGALDELAPFAQLVLLPMHKVIEEDRTAAAIIQSMMKVPEAFNVGLPQLGPADLSALIGYSDLVLASRLAAGTFAVAAGTPLIGLAYESRLIDLMSELGLGKYVVPWRSGDVSELRSIAARAWERRHLVREQLQSSRRPLVDSAWKNAEIISRHVG